MLQKHLDVFHIENINQKKIKKIIIILFNFFSKLKKLLFKCQFSSLNFLENYSNAIKNENNFYLKKIKKKKNNLLIICNSKETLKLINKNIYSDIIVVNDFFLSNLSNHIVPKYYLFFHPYEVGNKFKFAKDKYIYLKKLTKYVNNNKRKITFFFDASWKSILGNRENVFYVKFSIIPLCYYHDVKKINIEKKFPPVGNIAQACVLLGAYLQYKKIKLVGYNIDFFVGNLAGYNLDNHNHKEKRKIYLDSSGADDDFWMLAYIYSGWLILKKILDKKKIKFETDIYRSKLYMFKKN